MNSNNINDQSKVEIDVNSQQQKQSKKRSKKGVMIVICFIVSLIILISIVFILLTFGKTKILTCTQKKELYGITMTGKATIQFKRNNIDMVDMIIQVNLESYLDNKETFMEKIKEEYSDYEKQGIPVNIYSDETNIYIELSANISNFKIIGISSSKKYDDVKFDLESQGFVCK